MLKPEPVVKNREKQPPDSPACLRAACEEQKELEAGKFRPAQNRQRERITAGGPERNAERSIVVMNRPNGRGAKGPTRIHVSVGRFVSRLDMSTESYANTGKPEERYPGRDEIEDLPGNLADLRQKLHRKAKQEPEFQFYSLYGHILRRETLQAAFELVKSNGGAPGIDGLTFEEIEESPGGEEAFLDEIEEELRNKDYKPDPVLRVFIDKKSGGKRPLGIPTIKDRTVQMAALLVLEPIFEADFHECSHGFRPDRSAHQALKKVKKHLENGFRVVLDADLKSYFDTIPHENLLKSVQARVVDGSVLKLIRMWLEAPVVERYEDGSEDGHRPEKGTPQGGVISPLLANIYLHNFDVGFHREGGPSEFANAKLVRYADDFLVMARYQGERLKRDVHRLIEGKLELAWNREKTEIVDLNEGEKLGFLGYSYRVCGGKVRMEPSKETVNAERAALKEKLSEIFILEEAIEQLNRHLFGWARYFSLGSCTSAFEKINRYVRDRISKTLSRRSQRPFQLPENKTVYQCLQELGLIRLSKGLL